MWTNDELAARLPQRRDDEPPTLRQEILDELADHLACAADRERIAASMAGDDVSPDSIRRRVLNRFGNPACIARELWFAALSEKIMTQRISLGLLAVVCAALVGLYVFTWQAVASMQQLLAQQRETQIELLKRLRERPPAVAAAPNYDWCQLRLQLVKKGAPAADYRVTLQKLAGGETDNSKSYPFTDLKTDEEGWIDFGAVPYGEYYLTVNTPEGHYLKKNLLMRPGLDQHLTITCPSDVPTGRARLAWSAEKLQIAESVKPRVWILARISQPGFQVYGTSFSQAADLTYGGTGIAGERWQLFVSDTVLINQQGEIYRADWTTERTLLKNQAGGFPGEYYVDRLLSAYEPADTLSRISAVELPEGEYTEELQFVVDESPVNAPVSRFRLVEPDDNLVLPEPASWSGFESHKIVADQEQAWTIDWLRHSQTINDHNLARPTPPQPFSGANFGTATGFGGGMGGGGGFF